MADQETPADPLFTKLKDWTCEAWKAQAEWRDAAEDDYAFEAGHQWSTSEKNDMAANSRIPIVFNRTAVIISSVTGSEINNRTEVRFIPREIGDAKPNEVLTAGAEWFRDVANAEDEDSAAFHDLLVCGVGVTEAMLDWEEDPEGEPAAPRRDPLQCFWDPHSYRKGLTDKRFCGRVIADMPVDEAEERFGNFDISEINADWVKGAAEAGKSTNSVGDEYDSADPDSEEELKTVTVVQIQYRERIKVVEYVDPQTGKRAEMPADQWQKIIKRVPLNVPQRSYSRWEWKQCFLGRDEILEQNQPDPNDSTFNFMTGHWDRKEKRFYGLLRSMKDPQKFANKWLSQTLHIINSNAKGGVMVEQDAALDQQQFEDSWAAADGVTWMKAGAISSGKVVEKPKAQMPVALMSLTEFAITAIRDTSGVNMELLGLRDANQPGVLEYQRRQSAMTTLARFFDALRFYRKRQGQTILHFLRAHIAPTGRLVRIMKEDNVQYVPLAMDDETTKYDVIVDDAPSAPNEKEKAWSVIEAMMPMLQQADLGLDDWADILEYSPLPSSFADKVREKALAQKQQQPDPMQQKMMQVAVQKEESEVAENMASAELDQMKAQQIAQETQLAPISTLADLMAPQTPQPVVSPA